MSYDWAEPRPTRGRAPWHGEDGERHRFNVRYKEWLPKPMSGKDRLYQREPAGPITVMIVPGPNKTYSIVRVELATPVARGFKTKESARKWIERALRQGVLPAGLVEVEPPK